MTTATDLPQHMQALANANRIRLARAADKRELAHKRCRNDALADAAQLISSPPEHLLGLRVIELLASCHRMGPTSAAKVLRRPLNGRRQGVTIGDLTPAEKQRVLGAIWQLIGEAEG